VASVGRNAPGVSGDGRRTGNLKGQAMNLELQVNALGTQKKGADGKTLEDCKGNLSVYGLNARFPVSLYANQWLALCAIAPAIEARVRKAIADGHMSLERPDRPAKTKGNREAIVMPAKK
jgi:hypothetical protein